MTDDFLLSNYDKYADELIVEDSGVLPTSIIRKKKEPQS
jgi:hypothetical protein